MKKYILRLRFSEFEDFLEDLEEDPLYRQGVNIFKDVGAVPLTEDRDEDGLPTISLSEMLEDLNLEETEVELPLPQMAD